MHELPFIILARRGDDDGNQEQQQQQETEQEPAQDVLHEAETWRQSHVQGPCCCGLDSESTNVHAYIDRAGREGRQWQEGVWQRGRGRTLPQTTRVRKAINKQDTSRMSNINNKNESRCRTLHPFSHLSPFDPAPLPASCHSEHSHEWCLNGNVWVAARAELSSAAWQGCLLIYAVPIGATWDPQDLGPFRTYRAPPPFSATSLESSANRKYLCIMQSELRRIHNIEGVAREWERLRIAMPNNGNLLAENLIFMPPPFPPSLPPYLTGPLRV